MIGCIAVRFATEARSRHGVHEEEIEIRVFEVCVPLPSTKVEATGLTSARVIAKGRCL